MVFKEADQYTRDIEGYPIGSLPKLHKHYGYMYEVQDVGTQGPIEVDSREEAVELVRGRREHPSNSVTSNYRAVVWFTTEPVEIR